MRLEVTIPDPLFDRAKHAAAEHGFDSMAAYVVELISHDVKPQPGENYDHVFTPAVLAALDTAAAEARAGQSYTRKQVDEFLLATGQHGSQITQADRQLHPARPRHPR